MNCVPRSDGLRSVGLPEISEEVAVESVPPLERRGGARRARACLPPRSVTNLRKALATPQDARAACVCLDPASDACRGL